MPPAQTPPSRINWVSVGAAFAVWTLLAMLSIAESAGSMHTRGETVQWLWLAPIEFIEWYGDGIASTALVWIVRRYPAGVTRWRLAVPAYAGGLTAAIAIKLAIVVPLRRMLQAPGSMNVGMNVAQEIVLGFFVFSVVIAVLNVMELQRRLKDREQVALELRAQLSETELALLKGQLQPHFLFNTLNGVASLIHTAPDKADLVVVQLADLLRASLDYAGEREIPLAAELALVDKYLAIMEARFDGKLTVHRDIDRGILNALVPQFILQPLVENAFEHGIAQRGGAGQISMRIAREGSGQLRLEVSDDGAGVDPGAAGDTNGMGLSNTKLRLERLYGPHQSLTLTSAAQGGAIASVVIPLRSE